MTNNIHTPVLLEETLSYLKPAPGKIFVDCTLGAGGHTAALVEKGADVIAIDRDKDIIAIAKNSLEEKGLLDRVTIIHASFSKLEELVEKAVDGILFDLGVSSFQLDTTSRGFSFMRDAELDMRMDKTLTVKAKDLINGLGKSELIKLFEKYGEVRSASKIASLIIENRKNSPISTTKELADLISQNIHSKSHIHPATQVFQALRIAVNDEMGELKAALPSALSLLKEGGVMVVISFHSLEDRIVKEFIKSHSASGHVQPLVDKPVTASTTETSTNPRSRSAKLRALRKIKNTHKE